MGALRVFYDVASTEPPSGIPPVVHDDIVLVTQRNRPIAAVVSLKNVDREVLSLSRSPQFLKIIERSRRDFAAGQSRSLAEVRHLFGLSNRANERIQPSRKKRSRG